MTRPGELDETVSDSDAGAGRAGAASSSGAPATTLGRFEILSKLGEGGMGIVMLARDPLLGRKVALKVLRGPGGEGGHDRRARFLREARAMATVSHDNVIIVHEVGTHEGQDYVAMEYVAGVTLKRWQQDRGWRELVRVYERAGRGLAAAHDAGLVHRDFKPDNVMIGDDGRVRVTDFGLVAAIDGEQRPRSGSIPPELATSSLTHTGALLGTPRYMAPEQHLGEAVDARADQFAFCVSLYEALYQRPPFPGTSYAELSRNVIDGELDQAPPSEVPATIRDALVRGLSRDRADRFASLHELLAVLGSVISPAVPPRRRRTLIWAGGAIVVAGLVVVVVALLRTPHAAALQPKDMAHAQIEFNDAQADYEAGRYEQAAASFLASYEFKKFPAFLYNAGAAYVGLYRRDHDPAAARAAIAAFKRYLAAAPAADDRPSVLQQITELETAVGAVP